MEEPTMTTPRQESLLSKQQAKERLGIASDKMLQRLMRSGKLRAVKFGKTSPLRFREIDVRSCIERCITPGMPFGGEVTC
jgi:hypothetical protein